MSAISRMGTCSPARHSGARRNPAFRNPRIAVPALAAALALACAIAFPARAQTPPTITPAPAAPPATVQVLPVTPAAPAANAGAAPAPADAGKVVARGTVPDEATKSAVIARLRELYGADRVVDRMEVDSVVAPPNWDDYVLKLLGPNLKQVSGGELRISGNDVRISGEVANEAQRQQVASDISTSLNSTYNVSNALRVGAGRQNVLDDALANRIIEFESGSAVLTDRGRGILDEMAAAMRTLQNTRVEIIGHTDSMGLHQSNIALSYARADAVKAYLVANGIAPGNLSVAGAGPDRPVADNATSEGRARNRRIEFRVLK